MIKMGKVLKDDVENPHCRNKGIKSRMGRLLTRYHSKFKYLETAHLMHKDNKAELATLIDQYRQAMELLQAITERETIPKQSKATSFMGSKKKMKIVG